MGIGLFLDVGGTGIKSGILNENGQLLGSIEKYASHSEETAERIFRNIAEIIESAVSVVGLTPFCIGMAFPGPFDYDNGISYMKGIGKYDSIYGMSIADNVRKYLDESFSLIPMFFLHDIEAFALGVWYHCLDSYDGRMIAVAIGTGCGSAFIDSGKVLKNGKGVPPNGWIYDFPFKDGIIDDYVSKRGQTRLSMEIFGTDVDGRDLDELASKGDSRALNLFQRFGNDFTSALSPFIAAFHPDTVVIGGNISKSLRFFGEGFPDLCCKSNCRIIHDIHTSERTLEGLWIKRRRCNYGTC